MFYALTAPVEQLRVEEGNGMAWKAIIEEWRETLSKEAIAETMRLVRQGARQRWRSRRGDSRSRLGAEEAGKLGGKPTPWTLIDMMTKIS